MLARYHGTNLIKDRCFLYSGLLLFLSLSAVLALIFARGRARPPGPPVKVGGAPVEDLRAQARTAETQARPLEANVQAASVKAEALPQVRPTEGKTKAPETTVKSLEVPADPGRRLTTRRSFFEKKFGTLAVLPRATTRDAANRAGTFLVLQEYALHTLNAAHSPVWFQFNHYLPDSNGEPRHLGALIIVHSKTVGSRKVEIYRNPGWTRQNRSEILGEFSKSLDLSWEQFAAISKRSGSDTAKLQEVDEAFGGPWHAAPRGSDKYSWSYRKFWEWAVSTYESAKKGSPGLAQAERFRVSARLIAYVPTRMPQSKRPVVFSINAWRGDSVFVALYSLYNNGADVWSWHWILLK